MRKEGKKTWFIADGWIPMKGAENGTGLEGHEALIILNCKSKDAFVRLDFFFEDKDPIEGIKVTVPQKRVRCFRMDHSEDIGGIDLGIKEQYALKITSNVNIVVQFGRMDVTQSNLAYIGVMGYSE